MNVLDNTGEFKYTLMSEDTSQDIEYGIGEMVKVVKEKNKVKNTLKFLSTYYNLKLK